MLLRFTKMHGLGNDFVVIDGVSQNVHLDRQQIQYIANRNFGVGCDQLLIIEPPPQPDIDFNYRIYNANGEEVEQCGNGARCLGKYVSDKKLTGKRNIRISTCNALLHIEMLSANSVRVDMGQPKFSPSEIPLKADKQQLTHTIEHSKGSSEITAVSMGNPHAVIVVDDINNAPVETVGPILESHPDFPNKVNVGFMQILSPNSIKLRVFERGVGETKACGTGACAAVVAGRLLGLLENHVEAHLLGGALNIEYAGENSSVFMTGDAVKVFDGKLKL